MEVVDLHCDLLSYLAFKEGRTPLDPIVRCSFPQLKAGNVKTQVLAIFTETAPHSLTFGLKQIEACIELPKKYGSYLKEIELLPAFENASGFCLEDEPLEKSFTRLSEILEKITPVYISLTWNGENRFGGGCGSAAGLKEEGKELLKFLSGRGIAIDFSHASDRLALETLNFIDAEGLDLKILASHSNFRGLVNQERNLPDDIAKEIIQRKGLIGLVFYNKFLSSPKNLYEQIEHGLELGGENALCFGSDFFCLEDHVTLVGNRGGFYDELSDSSKYPAILHGIMNEMGSTQDQMEAFAFKNFLGMFSKT